MPKTRIICKRCDVEFSPHKHKAKKAVAVGAAATYGAVKGGTYGIVSGPHTSATGAGVGALLAGGATAFGAASVTKCPDCGKYQRF